MAITCPCCGAEFDVTLFQFGHRVQCGCGQWVDLDRGHVKEEPAREKEDTEPGEEDGGDVTS